MYKTVFNCNFSRRRNLGHIEYSVLLKAKAKFQSSFKSIKMSSLLEYNPTAVKSNNDQRKKKLVNFAIGSVQTKST